jgi:parallel beta-helix repeat protein
MIKVLVKAEIISHKKSRSGALPRKSMDRNRRIYMLSVTCLMAMLLTSGLFCSEVRADECTYYVDASAPDNGDGSAASPWNRFLQVNHAIEFDEFQPGDHICFKRGETFGYASPVSTMLNISSLVGTEQDPIVFEAYGDPGDPLPVIDGSQTLGDLWNQDATNPNIYSRDRWEQFRPVLLYYKGVPKPPITTLQFSSIPAGIEKNNILIQKDGVYTTLLVTSSSVGEKTVSGITRYTMRPDKNVYVRQLVDGVETTSPSIGYPAVKTQDALEGLTEPGHWYWEQNLSEPGNGHIFLYTEFNPNLNPIPVSFEGDAIRIVSSQYVVIRDIKVERVSRNGIVLYNSSNITIEDNTVFGCGLAGVQMWNVTDSFIRNNQFDANATGVEMYTEPAVGKQTVNNLVQNNSISNCRGACIGLSRDETTTPGDVSNNVITGNTITNANTMSYDGAGIYTFYAGANTIQANTIRNCGTAWLRSAGIMIDVSGGAMTISGNTIENNSLGGIVVSGPDHQITGNMLRNNGVSSWPSGQVGFFSATTAGTPAAASDCTVTGNTMEADATHHFITVEAGSSSGHEINHNTYRGQSKEQFLWTTGLWLDFPTWQATTGFDLKSTYTKMSPVMTATYLLLLGN